jgi:hypothetical protein
MRGGACPITRPYQHRTVLPHGKLEIKSLKRILVSHGEPIETDPRQTMRDLAGSIAYAAEGPVNGWPG